MIAPYYGVLPALLTRREDQEATRVNTPPLKEDTADGRPRGLFFDVSGPSDNQGGSESTESTRGTRNSNQQQKKSRAPGATAANRGKALQRSGGSGRTRPRTASRRQRHRRRQQRRRGGTRCARQPWFEFNLPEHLPSSPMCPANPKNKSEGKGVCVYHGRRKSVHHGSPGSSPGNDGGAGAGGVRRRSHRGSAGNSPGVSSHSQQAPIIWEDEATPVAP